MSDVRVRFAPSPTGHLHIGGARTAIYNWAFARRNQGVFILRIDDTDPERSTVENTEAILRSMRWLGLDWDEGPDVGGDHGPYFQTQRSALYSEGLRRLQESGAAYPCFCTQEDLEAKREAARTGAGPAGYDRTCRGLSAEEAAARVQSGQSCVWRISVPEDRGDIAFQDAVRGEMSFSADAMDDYVLVRSDGTPTYNFATVLDDIDMRISHVIRGDDHLSNTPRQILVYEALGESIPTFAHLSMIWGPDGKRLSKRHGATSIEAYRDLGYLPEAILNYLALLGWSLDGETTIIPSAVLKESFSLDRISRNPAIFDAEKLEWMNGVYIRELTPSEFVERMIPLLEAANLATADDVASRRVWFEEIAPLVSERVKHLDEIVEKVRFLFERVTPPDSAVMKLPDVDVRAAILDASVEALEALGPEPSSQDVETALRSVPEAVSAKPKVVFQTLRLAVTGSLVSPPLFESITLLGMGEAVDRIRSFQVDTA